MEVLFFVLFLLMTPFLVFRLIITDKEKGGTADVETSGSCAGARLLLASVFVGMCGFFLLGGYASVGFSVGMSGYEVSEWQFWGELLVCWAVSELVGMAPLVVARGKGYRVAVREWCSLASVAAVPYVMIFCVVL